MVIVYILIALLATTFGSMAGLGGGVIIKPAMEFMQDYDIAAISIISSITVFSMAVVSTYKLIRAGYKPKLSIAYIALGSILGGIIGKALFGKMLSLMDNDVAGAIQSIMLALILVVVLLRHKLPDYDLKNPFAVFLVGLILGTTASFLGVGGGPINVMVLMLFLNMKIKEAAGASIIVILLSQFSKIITLGVTGGLVFGEINIIMYMIPAAIIGGLLGTKIKDKISEHMLHLMFNSVVVLLVILNFYNAYEYLS